MEEYLWSCIVETAARCFQELAVLHEVGESEVSNFEVEVGVEEDVFGFEVSVGDEVEVGCFDPRDDFAEEVFGLLFVDIIILDVVIELSFFGHLHHNENVGCCVQHLIKLDNVGVVDKLQDADLPLDLLPSTTTFEIMFLFFIRALFMIFTATRTPVKS